jgi:PAS domain S-box-containing protein
LEISETKELFIDNAIGGSELLDLSDADLRSMGIAKVGHRKKILSKVAEMKGIKLADSSKTSMTTSMSDDTSLDIDQILVKCFLKDEVRTMKIRMNALFDELQKDIHDMYKKKLTIKYKDQDGDEVTIARDEDLTEAVRTIPNGPRRIFKLYLYERKSRADGEKSEDSGSKSRAPEPNAALSMMFSLFDSLLDACIVINDKCLVQYANKSAEKFTGFRSRELVGRNVNLLMTDEHKGSHDAYVKSYLKTGLAKVIGSGRDVVIQRKDGTICPCRLEVTEKNMGDNRLFVGMLKEVKETVAAKSLLQQEREVLDNLIVAAVVIDAQGTIHCFNHAAEAFFGFKLVEVVGKNINNLMPSPFKEKHTEYLQNYVKTGQAKIIGVGRDVVIQHKDGSLKPAHLSVTEKRDGDKRYFTGILQEAKNK